jgi:uncharacterized membrane protein (DUF485 family)
MALQSNRPGDENLQVYTLAGVPVPNDLKHLNTARWRITVGLTATMMVLYFGFILLVAFGKPLLSMSVVPGLSLGMLLGALVIVSAWVLIWVYVRWANRHYDVKVAELRRRS